MLTSSLFLVVFTCTYSLSEDSFVAEKLIHRDTFVKLHPSTSTDIHHIRIGVKENNLDIVERELLARSAPGNAMYQRWMESEEVNSLTRNEVAIAAIKSWMTANDIEFHKIDGRGAYIDASAPIETWESVLRTKFFLWRDEAEQPAELVSAKLYNRAEQYVMPLELREHVTAMFGVSQTPLVLRRHGMSLLRHRSFFKTEENADLINNLNSFYGITTNSASGSLNQAVFETTSNGNVNTFSLSDLNLFQSSQSITQQAATPVNVVTSTSCNDGYSCTEGNLDSQYIMGVAQGPSTYVWYGVSENGMDAFTNVLHQIYNTSSSSRPDVVSISYGSAESSNSAANMNAFNTEAMMLGLIGVTVFVSSGDGGANSATCAYSPSYPATSPYVTAVGATMGPEQHNTEIVAQTAFANTYETVTVSNAESLITSGGGFSTNFVMPSYQRSAVSKYLAKNSPPSGFAVTGRAYPDVAFIGVDYGVYVTGSLERVDGTSASSPLFAALTNLVNSERKAKGLGTVGFINPTLYNNSNRFTDITSGSNNCGRLANVASSNTGAISGTTLCCTTGFSAAAGWDPVSGLGSIQFSSLSLAFNVTAKSNGGSSGNGQSSCFASSETVQLDDGSYKPISQLQLGDKILVADMHGTLKGYSAVIAIPHKGHEYRAADTLTVTTVTNRQLKLTADHLVLTDSCAENKKSAALVEARLLKPGVCVVTVTGREKVTSVRPSVSFGLLTAVTQNGDMIVVNGIVASPFAVNHAVTDAFYAVHRLFRTVLPAVLESTVFCRAMEYFGELATLWSA